MKFWGNVETFDQRFWTSAPLERVKRQLEIVNGYVGNIICFAYSHYNSPFIVNEDYHKAYLEYCKSGQLPKMALPEKVTNANVQKLAEGVKIEWVANNSKGTVGYSIYRDGELLKRLQAQNGIIPITLVDKDGDLNRVYEIAAYNVIGNESIKVKAE